MTGNEDARLRSLAEATTRIRHELPERCGGPQAEYSPLFIENAFAKHAPGDEGDPDLRRIWQADATFIAAANPTAVLALLDRVHNAENIARLAEESEAGWRREADEVGARLLRVEALADEFDDDMSDYGGYYAHDLRAALAAAPDETRGA